MIEPQNMDIFFKGNNLDVAAAINAFWQNKESQENTEQLCHLLSRYLVEKDTFDEIEFFIPQMAHMIIHFGSSNRKLWKFMVMVCQVSVHSALLLSFIFYAAMEDYQPEDAAGVANPHKNLKLHTHCARLLASIEKVILLGSPELLKLDRTAPESERHRLEFEEMEAESRIRDSELIVSMESGTREDCVMSGELFYKRVEKKSMLVRKTWKPRFFKIENKVLNCYHDSSSQELLRSIPLQDCQVFEVHNPHHENCFEVHSPITFTVFKLQAPSREEMLKWIDGIKAVIEAFPQVKGGVQTAPATESVTHGDVVYEVTTEQKNRFHFFLEQRRFVESMTKICEELRFMDPKLHQDELKQRVRLMQFPSHCYLNLCRSTDVWSKVINTLPEESHAFKTKARVPTLMFFEVQDHSEGHDVATFLGGEIGAAIAAAQPDASPPEKELKTVHATFKTSTKSTLRTRRQSMWSSTPISLRSMSSPDEESEDIDGDHAKLEPPKEKEDDTSKAGESFSEKMERIRKSSPYSHLPGWRLDGLICKSNDDLRQEVFVMQMIKYFIRIFEAEKVDVWLLAYTIMSTSQTTGLIQLIPNAQSLDGMKKSDYWPGTLRGYFEKTFGPTSSDTFKNAVNAYISSMAGYSVACYILAIKDRHNGNIMMDNKGRIIHIDYGFVFGIAPGKKFSMETAPWKLTEEMVEVMGGLDSPGYARFVTLTTQALRAVRKYTNEFLGLMEILAYKSNYPAFTYNPNAMSDLRDRMMPTVSDAALPAKVEEMMRKSYKHAGAIRYDKFQVLTNGIAK